MGSGGVRRQSDPSGPRRREADVVRVRRRRVVIVTGLAVALFAAGGVGIWTRSQTPPSAVAAPVTGPGGASVTALQDHPLLAADSLAQTIAALQARITALPRD